jgi:hypothetical protein
VRLAQLGLGITCRPERVVVVEAEPERQGGGADACSPRSRDHRPYDGVTEGKVDKVGVAAQELRDHEGDVPSYRAAPLAAM